MGAQVTVRNEGPDSVQVRVGDMDRLLPAGGQVTVATTHRVDVQPLQPLSRARMREEMGLPPEPIRKRYRSANEDD